MAASSLGRPAAFSALSCPSASLCVAVGGSDVFTSTDPAAGAATWSAALSDPPIQAGYGSTHTGLIGVSRPSSTECYALEAVNFQNTISPTEVDNTTTLKIISSTDPVVGAASWSDPIISNRDVTGPSNPLQTSNGLSCPTVSCCDAGGPLPATPAASGPWNALLDAAGRGAARWRAVRAQRFAGADALACPTLERCVATLRNGKVLSTRRPDAGPNA